MEDLELLVEVLEEVLEVLQVLEEFLEVLQEVMKVLGKVLEFLVVLKEVLEDLLLNVEVLQVTLTHFAVVFRLDRTSEAPQLVSPVSPWLFTGHSDHEPSGGAGDRMSELLTLILAINQLRVLFIFLRAVMSPQFFLNR